MNKLAKNVLFSLVCIPLQSLAAAAGFESFAMNPSSGTTKLLISFSGSFIGSPQSSSTSWNFSTSGGIASGQYIKNINYSSALQPVTMNMLQAVPYEHME